MYWKSWTCTERHTWPLLDGSFCCLHSTPPPEDTAVMLIQRDDFEQKKEQDIDWQRIAFGEKYVEARTWF